MLKTHVFSSVSLVVLTVFSIGGLSVGTVYATSCCGGGSNPKEASPGNGHPGQMAQRYVAPEPPSRAPHGGQLAATTWHNFEIVYGPHETRVYVYDTFRVPTSARGISGHAFMRVRSNGGEYRYPLEFVPVQHGHDYLAIRVDLTRVHDGDMDVLFEMAGMPSREAPTARISSLFARPPIADRGHSVGRPLLTNARGSQPARSDVHHQTQRIVVSGVTAADHAAIRAQGVCPVMNQSLGSHGDPTKVLIDGQPVFVCCAGCVSKVKQNPGQYLAKVSG